MKLISNKKKTLFDGDQEELFSAGFKMPCLNCSGVLTFKPGDFKSCSTLDNTVSDFVIPKIKRVKSINLGDDVFYKVDGLPLKYDLLTCESCKAKYFGFFGVGEYQPTRFMLILVALILTD